MRRNLTVLLVLLCALVSFGFNSNAPSTGGGGGAPIVNPPGGQNNYLPINQPAFTGLLSGPTATLTTSLTLPSSQSWTNTGIATLALTLPAGQAWNNTGLTATVINLTGTAPSLLFNGTPMGGTCTGVEFVNAISATGVPSCATPAGGGGGLPTPVSVANGGLGQGAAPAVADILVATSATEYQPVPMSGDVTITAAGVTTVNRTLFAPLVNPANGQNNYAPLASPAFTGTTTATAMQVANTLSAPTISASGSLTISTGGILMLAGTAALYFNGTAPGGTCAAGSVVTAISATIIPTCTPVAVGPGSITDAMLANPYSGVGACTAGDFVTALNRNAAPTCAAPPGVGTFAPLNNPAGGQNNYAPINNAVFTGTFTVPAAVITDANLANGYSGIGTCPGGEFVTTLARNVAPICAAPAAGNFAPLTNPAGGQNNYAPIGSPTFTGTVIAPIVNASTAFQLNGVAFGGTCPAGEFVEAISAGVIPTCDTPAGGGLPTPVPVTDGGTGTGTAPTLGQILVAASATAYAPVNMSGNVTISATGVTTIGAAQVTDAMLANAYSGVGACAAGSVATTLNRNAAPTCTALTALGAGLFAPLNNPLGGQNNYLPIDNPTYTTNATGPSLLLNGPGARQLYFQGAGNINQPGASIAAPLAGNLFLIGANTVYTGTPSAISLNPTLTGSASAIQMNGAQFLFSSNTGLTQNLAYTPNTILAMSNTGATFSVPLTLGNLTAPSTATWTFPDGSTYTSAGHNNMAALGIGMATNTDPLSITRNANANAVVQIYNPNAGANATTAVTVNNAALPGPLTQAVMQITGTGYTANPNIGANTAVFSGNGTNGVDVVSFLNTTTAPVRIWANGNFQAIFGGAQLGTQINYPMGIQTPPPTNPGGILAMEFNGNANASASINNNTAGAAASSTFYVGNDLGHYASMQIGSSAFTGTAPLPPDSATFGTDTANGIQLASAVSTSTINMWVANTKIAAAASNGLQSLNTMYVLNPVSGAATNNGMIGNNAQFNVVNGGSQELAGECSGIFLISELNGGDTGEYLCGGGGCTFVTSSRGNFHWGASTTAPPAGQASVAMDGNSKYTLYNNIGATVGFMAITICPRAGT